jgi:hypothetical protein
VPQQRGERFRDGCGRVAQADEQLAVVVEDVGGGEVLDTAERLGVEQQQAGRGAGADVGVLFGREPA